MNIYVIGGSPCSGKSTAAQAIAEQYGLYYFKVDENLDRYMQMAAADRKECCARAVNMSPEEIWMRPPQVQCTEELRIYEEIFEYIRADLEKLDRSHGIITEGAAYLPVLAKEWGLPEDRYISITPTKEFQVHHYSRRAWVPHVLAGCSDPAQAFANWMERDALFAEAVRRQCADAEYASIVNDGSVCLDEMQNAVAAHFALK